jgi:hypothetical protein
LFLYNLNFSLPTKCPRKSFSFIPFSLLYLFTSSFLVPRTKLELGRVGIDHGSTALLYPSPYHNLSLVDLVYRVSYLPFFFLFLLTAYHIAEPPSMYHTLPLSLSPAAPSQYHLAPSHTSVSRRLFFPVAHSFIIPSVLSRSHNVAPCHTVSHFLSCTIVSLQPSCDTPTTSP